MIHKGDLEREHVAQLNEALALCTSPAEMEQVRIAYAMPAGFQQTRSEKEQALPDYVRDQLDAARSGYDIRTNRKMSADEVRALLAGFGLDR